MGTRTFCLAAAVIVTVLVSACKNPHLNNPSDPSNLESSLLNALVRSMAPVPLRLFVSAAYSPSGSFTSAATADVLCDNDGRKPAVPGAHFKAMLGAASVRVASVGASVGDGQIDWVLRPGAVYINAAGATVGTAGSNGLLSSMGAPLDGTLSSGVDYIWTGLNAQWQNGTDCTAWGGSGNGALGDPTSTTLSAMLATTQAGCAGLNRLLCVQQ
ncbi:MAG: DUF1554 domain-containing protein [Spirochaetia bacterium]|nr:DUF1554 domain-containing protein [Spirochaetia bacterium]